MRGSRRLAGMALMVLGAAACARHDAAVTPPAYRWQLPPGIPVPRVPADNPMTDAKVRLGRRLFHDTRLSGNGTFACASCHRQEQAFTDGRARAIGSTGQPHARGTMSLANAAYNASLGWADGTARSLEAQMAGPMFNEHPIELGLAGRQAEVLARFSRDTAVVREFEAAFPEARGAVSMEAVVKAIASFERTLVSGSSPLDRYLYRDDRSALSDSAARGMTLFFSDRLACSSCHGGFNLSGPTDYEGAPRAEPAFHNTGLHDADRAGFDVIDRGLMDVTRVPSDRGRFRAPTLRNIALTAPYMHDGSIPTLEAVIAHYASGGRPSRFRDPRLKGFRLTPRETRDLVAFLEALTDRDFITNPAFGRP